VCAVVLACAVSACAQLIGTDFTGTPRSDASAREPEAGARDATTAGDGGGGGGDAGEDSDDATAAEDTNEPRWAYCELHGGLCSCIPFSIPVDSGFPCDQAHLPSGFCCADPGYPYDDSAYCTCGTWTCHVSTETGSCLCGAYSDGGVGQTCTGDFCCAHDSLYTCGCADASSRVCIFGDADTQVTSCTESNQPCPHGGKRVTSCTAF